MGKVVSELEKALNDKRKNCLGLFDSSRGKPSKKTKTATLESTVKTSTLLPDPACFSGRNLRGDFFDSNKAKVSKSKRERDELSNTGCTQMDGVVTTGHAANDIVCAKRSKLLGEEGPLPPITINGLFPASRKTT
jgi:hypothetical protein